MKEGSRLRGAARGARPRGVGARRDPEEAVAARLGEVDERPPVGRGPGRRERQPVGAVGVLEGPPRRRDGRPGGGGGGGAGARRAAGAVGGGGRGGGPPRPSSLASPCQTMVPARTTARAANTTGSRIRRRPA